MRLLAAAFSVAFALALPACSSTPTPETTRYLMRAPVPGTSGPHATPRVGLRRVVVASYLQKAGLAVEIGPGQVHSARFHEWAEPLDEGLRSFLVPALTAALGEPMGGAAIHASGEAYALDVYVDQLHGTEDGDAILVSEWRLMDKSGREAARSSFVKRAPLAKAGYAGLAEAELALAGDLAAAIADSLRGVLQ